MRLQFCLLLSISLVAALPRSSVAQDAACPPPKQMHFQLSQKISRETLGFTQGLEFVGNRLLEGTGALGNGTSLNSIGLNGHVTQLRDFDTNFFGEGITVFGGKI